MSDFKKFKVLFQSHFTNICKKNTVLFETETDKETIWNIYIDSFPEGTNPIYRKFREYECSCCKSFIRQYGNIVAIQDNKVVSIWDVEGAEFPFNVVSQKMSEYVKSKKVVNRFIPEFCKLGTDNNRELSENNSVTTYDHFYFELPKSFMVKSSATIDTIKGNIRAVKEVFKRSMDELTLDAGRTILELIDQGSLYRGDEHKKAINEFISYKNKYSKVKKDDKDNWCWINSNDNPVAKIRNTALGTLLIDLSEGVDLDTAVTKFEKVMAPTNYKRPKTIFTKKMVEDAEKKLIELGYENSLERRFANIDDITINNVLFANKDVRKKLTGTSVFDSLKSETPLNVKTLNKVEEVAIEDFIKNILPTTKSIEVMMENKHNGNLMSLIAPKDKTAPSMLKWNNNFSWAYNGDITDSIKQNVKNAGGNVDGVLRFSIQWNDNRDNDNDFDAHCKEPYGGTEIYFRNKGIIHPSSGMLDVDIRSPKIEIGNNVAVENITWTDKNKMREGKYIFFVNNFHHRGGRSGFSAEIEYEGQIFQFIYDKELKQDQNIVVAELEFTRKEGIKIIKSLESTTSSKEIWGVKTNTFVPVSIFLNSPNYWDDQKGIGNKHYFFMMKDCINSNNPRGFFNEFLDEKLTPHRKVFEALGSKMSVEMTDNQLSGLGFSSTQRNDLIVKIEGNFNRTIKLIF